MSKFAATCSDFNYLVWHDTTVRTGAQKADEYFFHSVRDANAKAKMLKRLYPRDAVRVISRQEHDERCRAYEEYLRQDCS